LRLRWAKSDAISHGPITLSKGNPVVELVPELSEVALVATFARRMDHRMAELLVGMEVQDPGHAC